MAGLSGAFVKNIEMGLSQTPRPDTLARLAEALKTTPEWLLHGDTKEPPATGPAPPQHSDYDLPIMGTSQGENGDIFLNGHVADLIKRPPALLHRRKVFVLYVAGTTMEPAYYDGDPIIIDPDRPPTTGDDIVIEMKSAKASKTAGAFYLRSLVKRSLGNVITRQYNPPKEIKFAVKDIANIYRVVTRREILGI
jgi:phage repressor protein C with HTH and peptisase S24 domain